MTINERIQNIVDELYNGNKAAFAKSIGKAPTTVANILGERKTNPSSDFIESIKNSIENINPMWLLTGIGDMLAHPNTISQMKEIQGMAESVDMPKISYNSGTPYYNVDFIGGFDLIVNDQTINPDYYIDFKKYNEADCWCNITGHSMEPEITHGDIIALKEVKDWKAFLPFGEVYGIVTTEHRTVKRVTGSVKEGFFRLIPTNTSPEYAPQDIPVSLIVRVYKVLGCMKRL